MTAMRAALIVVPFCLGLVAAAARPSPNTPAKSPERHRSPAGVTILPDGRRALTANYTADSVSLVDVDAGKVLAEIACGRKPVAIVCSADGRRAAVSNHWSDSVTLFEVSDVGLKTRAEIAVGRLPQGAAFAPDGSRLYVAAGDDIVEVDWSARRVAHRWAAPGGPRSLALSADGRLLAALSDRSAELRLWDASSRALLGERAIDEGFNLRGLTFAPDGESLVFAHLINKAKNVSLRNIEEGWLMGSRLTRVPIKAKRLLEPERVALDTRGAAVGDPYWIAFGDRGRYLALTASGTQELLLFQSAALPWNGGGDPGDLIDSSLALNDGRMRRLPLGGRPMGVAVTPDGKTAAVANYLLDAVQVVDLAEGRVVRSIPLGGPTEPSAARRGEALFYDARRSHHRWLSCHTCHVDGHTNGQNWDTLNDESFGNPKLTPSLRGVSRTGPWTWHGWQTDLGAAVEKSFSETLYGPKPTADEMKDVLAFLGTLDHPPRPALSKERREAAARGQTLFEGKARCARCHAAPDYTTPRNYDVKLEPDGSPFKLWNPPSLRGVAERGPYLHDGRAATLDEVLRADHAPEKLGGAELSPAERADLVEFLRSL
jgi:YVTN family beta-propeller protein